MVSCKEGENMTGSLQEKNGRYYAVLNIKDKFGRAKTKWVALNMSTKMPTKKAKEKFQQILLRYDILSDIVDSDISFVDFSRRWLRHINQKESITPITKQGYETIVEKHIVPYFSESNLKVKEITPQIIETYYKNKMTDTETKKGLKSKTIRGHQSVFSGILKYALKENLVGYNAASRVELPPLDKPNVDFYDNEEVKLVFDTIKNERLYPCFFFMVFYGLRRSEALGLKWSDIDWSRNTIHIQRSLSYSTEIVCREGTKTSSSNRYYPLNDLIKVLLNRVQHEQNNYKKLFGREYSNSGFIFTKINGEPIAPNTLSAMWIKILKKYNLKRVRLHDLRHSCASLLIDKGFELKDVSEWLGHSDIGVTANLYGHLFDQKKRDMADKFANFFAS